MRAVLRQALWSPIVLVLVVEAPVYGLADDDEDKCFMRPWGIPLCRRVGPQPTCSSAGSRIANEPRFVSPVEADTAVGARWRAAAWGWASRT